MLTQDHQDLIHVVLGLIQESILLMYIQVLMVKLAKLEVNSSKLKG